MGASRAPVTATSAPVLPSPPHPPASKSLPSARCTHMAEHAAHLDPRAWMGQCHWGTKSQLLKSKRCGRTEERGSEDGSIVPALPIQVRASLQSPLASSLIIMTLPTAFLDPTCELSASHQLFPVILQATLRQVSLFPPFYRQGQWSPERGGRDLLKITERQRFT